MFCQWFCGATGKQQGWRGWSSVCVIKTVANLSCCWENWTAEKPSHSQQWKCKHTAGLDKQVGRIPDYTNSNTPCPGSRWNNTRRTWWHFPPVSITTATSRKRNSDTMPVGPSLEDKQKKMKELIMLPWMPEITAYICLHQPPPAHEGNQLLSAHANNTATLPLRDNNTGTEPLLADVVKSPQEKGWALLLPRTPPASGPNSIHYKWLTSALRPA